MTEAAIFKKFILKYRIHIVLICILFIISSIYTYRYVSFDSKYLIEYKVSNKLFDENMIGEFNNEYNRKYICNQDPYLNICIGKSKLNEYLSCAITSDNCQKLFNSHFNFSTHINYFDKSLSKEINNNFKIKLIDNKNTIFIVINDAKKTDNIVFQKIIKKITKKFNDYINESFNLSFEKFNKEIITSLKNQIELKNEFNLKLDPNNENLNDYINSIYTLNNIYLEIFSNDLKKVNEQIKFFEFDIFSENIIIQSKYLYTYSQHLALNILLFLWTIIIFYFFKRNTLSKL